jgi:SAM-dependent methyltransferase
MRQTIDAAASYYDSSYYQAGHKKGTRYSDYLQDALSTNVYRAMANAIATVFRPARVLEIGCAAGPIVKHLIELGVDAHGIDVSEWAVANRFHPNVVLGSADDLPYPDNSFDLVFSVHALEHLPDAVADGAFAEMSRVAAGHQFHILPLIGIAPYDGPLEESLANLRSDPTHNLLYDRGWWLEQWWRKGWRLVPANILLEADNSFFEFSTGQMILSRNDFEPELLRSIQDFNLSFFKRVSSWDLRRRGDSVKIAQIMRSETTVERAQILSLQKGVWGELGHRFAEPRDLRDATVYLFCRFDAPAPLDLRLAAISFKEHASADAGGAADIAGVAQLAIQIPPGSSAVELQLNELSLLYDSPHPQKIDMLLFGGEAPFAAKVECFCVLKSPAGVEPLWFRPYSTLWARLGRFFLRLTSKRAG